MSKAGWYRSPNDDEELIVIFRFGSDWYWQRMAFDHSTSQGMVIGPYLSYEEAYQEAIATRD